MGGWGTAVKSGIKFAVHNPKTALGMPLGTVVAWKYFVNDESLLEQATEVAVSDEASKALKEKGVAGGVKTVFFGEEGAGKSVGENVVDNVVGKGTYNKIGEKAGNVADAAGEGIQDVYNGARDMVSGLVHGRDGQGQGKAQYQPPTDMTDYQQQALTGQQGNGLFSSLGLFSGVGNAASSILGGGTGLSLAALIPAALLMFGNFGWIGKLASLFLGSLAFKNMRQQQVLMPEQPALPVSRQQLALSGTRQQLVLSQQARQSQIDMEAQEEESNNHVIRRGRV